MSFQGFDMLPILPLAYLYNSSFTVKAAVVGAAIPEIPAVIVGGTIGLGFGLIHAGFDNMGEALGLHTHHNHDYIITDALVGSAVVGAIVSPLALAGAGLLGLPAYIAESIYDMIF